jgi:hypothetical protein
MVEPYLELTDPARFAGIDELGAGCHPQPLRRARPNAPTGSSAMLTLPLTSHRMSYAPGAERARALIGDHVLEVVREPGRLCRLLRGAGSHRDPTRDPRLLVVGAQVDAQAVVQRVDADGHLGNRGGSHWGTGYHRAQQRSRWLGNEGGLKPR